MTSAKVSGSGARTGNSAILTAGIPRIVSVPTVSSGDSTSRRETSATASRFAPIVASAEGQDATPSGSTSTSDELPVTDPLNLNPLAIAEREILGGGLGLGNSSGTGGIL